jgi:hypothetical protein
VGATATGRGAEPKPIARAVKSRRATADTRASEPDSNEHAYGTVRGLEDAVRATLRAAYSAVGVVVANVIWFLVQMTLGSNTGVADGQWNGWSPALLLPLLAGVSVGVAAALSVWPWRRWRLVPIGLIALNVVPAVVLLVHEQAVSGRPDDLLYVLLFWVAPVLAAVAGWRTAMESARQQKR